MPGQSKGKLEKLNQKIKICKKCALWKLRKNAVPGQGSVNAKVMVIGQAPGVKEDLSGKPFCGRAGKFLNHLLGLAQIKRKEIFITSLLKCLPQPPINRKPTKKEIEACLPWLKEQIEIINPQKFILLGEVAFSVFFPGERLDKFRGRWLNFNFLFPSLVHLKKKIKGISLLEKLPKEFWREKEFFPTYHPAAGLRFPKIKKILEKDFKKLKNI